MWCIATVREAPNGTCTVSGMEKLFCAHCKKTYSVEEKDIRLVAENGKNVVMEAGTFRFEQGCFFKALAAFKRQKLRR